MAMVNTRPTQTFKKVATPTIWALIALMAVSILLAFIIEPSKMRDIIVLGR